MLGIYLKRAACFFYKRNFYHYKLGYLFGALKLYLCRDFLRKRFEKLVFFFKSGSFLKRFYLEGVHAHVSRRSSRGRGGEGERERERMNLRQAPCSAWSPTPCSVWQPRDHNLSWKSRVGCLTDRSHPGAPWSSLIIDNKLMVTGGEVDGAMGENRWWGLRSKFVMSTRWCLKLLNHYMVHLKLINLLELKF